MQASLTRCGSLVLVLAACGGGELAPDAVPPDAMVDAVPPRCLPEAGATAWFEEGEAFARVITCAGTVAVAEAGLEIIGLPDGASFDATTGALAWTPGLDQAGIYTLVVQATATDDELVRLRLGVADAFDAPDNQLVVDPLTYTHEFGLPVFHLSWTHVDPDFCISGAADDFATAAITVNGHVYADAQLKCRGATSSGFPKKSFLLRFSPDDKYQGTAETAGLAGRERVVLTQTFDDVSYLRTRLAFEVWNRRDPSHLALQHGSAVVFIDGEYWGLYQATDHVDGDYLNDNGLSPDGDLYKSINHNGNLRNVRNDGNAKASPTEGYEKEEGVLDEHAALIELLDWVSEASDEVFAAEVAERLDVLDFVDWHVFATAIQATDSYGKNSYIYRDPADPNPRWRYIPWDMNHAFGQTWQTYRTDPLDQPLLDAYPLSRNGVWARLAAHPTFLPMLRDRYLAALLGDMSADAVVGALRDMAAAVAPSARRDYRKWGEQMETWGGWSDRTDFNDFDGEIDFIETWIRTRWAALLADFS